MENMAEALKIAFAAMMFVMALTLSISSFSQARNAVDTITSMRDRDIEWAEGLDYVIPSENLTRVVGIETVVTSIYTAFEENIEIYFLENDGKTPIDLYYDTLNGRTTGKVITTIDFENTTFKNKQDQIDFLDIIIGGNDALNRKEENVKDKYRASILYTNGLYHEFKDFKFEEKLGEYKQGTGSSAITKRVITYIKQ